MSPILNPPFPLGPILDGGGVRFTLYSGSAKQVEVCLFDSPESIKESRRLLLNPHGSGFWSLWVPDVPVGSLYGFRVHGPYHPKQGHRFNPNKIVLDPYAPAIGRLPRWEDRLFGTLPEDPAETQDLRDNADIAPLGRITNPEFDWENDQAPHIPWQETVLYETHVKGISQQHPEITPDLAGSYSALGSPPLIRHLKQLGVTTIELMPVHQKYDEWHCHHHGLTNYWGYSSLLYLAPDVRFARRYPEDPAREFKEMVKALHRAGLEVILDVVYNHTAEADHRGPTLSLRGIDNAAYYRLDGNRRDRYEDFTGCGNTVNLNHPAALGLVLDSLRFWVRDMHVDGFRFDLAPTLVRGKDGNFNPEHPLFTEIKNDPVLSKVKWIAEPWDLGAHGYRLGEFPKGWAEWNGQYRDVVRRFWRGEDGMTGLFASRFCGSEDIFGHGQRSPLASINFVTCHDGFTLADLVAYRKRHNLDNLEDNRDGPSENFSVAFGPEGKTKDSGVLHLREQQRRNLMATLLLSIGVPMLSGGDEWLRTQGGNNNAWCQDNPKSWYDWSVNEERTRFMEFCSALTALRRRHPFLGRETFLTGEDQGHGRDVVWLHASGREMNENDWEEPGLKSFGAWFNGNPDCPEATSLLILFHAERSAISFHLPALETGCDWKVVVDTQKAPSTPGELYKMNGPSLAVFESSPQVFS